jgi:hypothetical protein
MDIIIIATTIQLSNKTSFTVYTNLGDQMTPAFEAWSNKTNDYTAQSFCDFVNSKRLAGLTSYIAFTEERWLELQAELKNKPA